MRVYTSPPYKKDGTLKLVIVSSPTPPTGGIPNRLSGKYPPAGELPVPIATRGGAEAANVPLKLIPLFFSVAPPVALPRTSSSFAGNLSVRLTSTEPNVGFVIMRVQVVFVFNGI